MRLSIFFLAIALQAQDVAKPGIKAGVTTPPTCSAENPSACVYSSVPSCDATDWKAYAEGLEKKLALTEARSAALAQFYAANEQLAGLAGKEPPKPASKPAAP